VTKRIKVGVVFGGRSGEHEISLRSADSIIRALDPAKYECVPIAITRSGKWLTSSDATLLLPGAVIEAADTHVAILGDPTETGLQQLGGTEGSERGPERGPERGLDVVFPVLHGTFGEDGTIQGLLEMAGIPYVGCGVLASAAGMDKVIMKHLFREAGLPIVEFTSFLRTKFEEDAEAVLDQVVDRVGFPCFAKPANLGSSVGISKAKDRKSLSEGIVLASRFDRKVIVEQGVDAREIEVSVLGNDSPEASLPGEIIPQTAEFYDYKAKYLDDNGARLEIPAKLPPAIVNELQDLAVRAFKAIDGSGLARVDFFLLKESGKILVNEINTMPGFTSISMYPKLWEASGVDYAELVDRLIALAIERHKENSRNAYE
jgi:D-alanine-D-alanine ligase